MYPGYLGNPGQINAQQSMQRLMKMRDDLDEQIKNFSQTPMIPIQQNFNLAPNNMNDFDAKWVNDIDEVNKTPVYRDTIFMKRDMPIFYLKTADGVKSFKFEEYVELDEKDLKIRELEEKIDMLMKGSVNDGKSVNESNGDKVIEQSNNDSVN